MSELKYMKELDRCPFCGNRPRMKNDCNENGSEFFQVTHDCTNLLSEIKTFCYTTEKAAMEAWNRRTPDIGITASENKPLTLEELRGMDGEPVWCESLTEKTRPDMWCIYRKGFDRCSDGEWDFYVDGAPDEYYGKTWLAYCRKPEAKEEDCAI